MDTVISMFYQDGHHARICMRCHQYVTADGKPDPWYYNGKEIAYFEKIPPKDRCDHRRKETRMLYGHSNTYHQTEYLDVETDKHGKVVAVWFRCMLLPFKQSPVNGQRAAEMDRAYKKPPRPLVAVEVADEE